jgi:hypothetical protein
MSRPCARAVADDQRLKRRLPLQGHPGLFLWLCRAKIMRAAQRRFDSRRLKVRGGAFTWYAKCLLL